MDANLINLIVYHNACPDGWCAAYIAKKRFPCAELLPQDHGKEPPYDKLRGKRVLVVDFSWRTQDMNDKVYLDAEYFQIFDHHKTAQEVLSGRPYAVFDMNRSGAGLTFDLLFPDDHRPWYVNYVEDRDLWRFDYPDSRAVNEYLLTLPYTVEGWDQMNDISAAIDYGYTLLKQKRKNVSMVVEHAQEGRFGDSSVGVVNAPYFLSSDVGEELTKKYNIGLIWFERNDGMMQFSLRSRGELDVSTVARMFNGGGQRNAAGFNLPIHQGRVLLDTMTSRGEKTNG